MYKLHVRGFTMTAPGVRHRGTYRGLLEKKPYLLELGVNALLLMPCVEFDEASGLRETTAGSDCATGGRGRMQRQLLGVCKGEQLFCPQGFLRLKTLPCFLGI